jgi:N-formylglutamate amidohydrolase
MGALKDAKGFTAVLNGRFTGGYITRHYGQPETGIHALQLEMAEIAYMDEAPPFAWDPARAERLVTVLRQVVEVLIDWASGV